MKVADAGKFPRTIGEALCWLLPLALIACSSGGRVPTVTSPWANAGQLVLVTTPGWNASQGTLRTYESTTAGWREVNAAVPVTIGRSGSAWGIGLHPDQPGPSKVEGDGRAPAGVFRIGSAFGYAPASATSMPYLAMSATHYCVDVSGAALYNRVVDERVVGEVAVAGSTEPMRRDIHVNGDQRYKLGFVIEHNPEGRRGAGSCIFAHMWRKPGEATAGCTAMDEPAMQRLFAWLNPRRQPVFVLLPEAEYRRLRAAWNLP